VLVLVAAAERIDPDYVRAARALGASRARAFWTVTFPLSLPGIALAATISFLWALGAFVSPYLLGSPEEITLAVEVQRQAFENVNWPRAAATAVLMLALLGASAGALHVLALRRAEAAA
jgi:ABC-type spermidine/putrescine transport system permease subunit I